MKTILFAILFCSQLFLTACAGLKMEDPKEKAEKKTLMVDWSGASPSIIKPWRCTLESGGNKFSALAKTEEEAKTEVLGRCHDRTLISNCKLEQAKCEKNH